MAWLLREGDVLAALESRRRNWAAELQGALVLPGSRIVSTLSTTVALDVAWCVARQPTDSGNRCLEVKRIGRLGPRRVCLPRPGLVLIAGEGAFDRWRLQIGDQLEIQ